MSAVWDISLYGDSLKEWRSWEAELKQQEWLIGWARFANKIVVAISLPFVLAARIIGIPLMFIDLLTFRLFTAPLRLILALSFNLVLWSSGLWVRTPSSRPVLIITQPLIISLTMVLIALTPLEEDIRDTQNILCELWPLSRRRLEWILERGSGKPEKADQTDVTGNSEEQHEDYFAKAWEEIAQIKFRRHWGISRELFWALAREWKDAPALYEASRKTMTDADVEGVFKLIADPDLQLTLEEKAIADFALLTALEGSVPSQEGLAILRTVFGDEFVETILAKQ